MTEAITYTKSASFHLWLLGYEFTGERTGRLLRPGKEVWVGGGRPVGYSQLLLPAPTSLPAVCCNPPIPAETILVFTKSEMHALAGPKKTDILAQLEGPCTAAGVKLVLHPKPKKEDGAAQIASLVDACKASAESPVVGTLPKVRRDGRARRYAAPHRLHRGRHLALCRPSPSALPASVAYNAVPYRASWPAAALRPPPPPVWPAGEAVGCGA